MLRSFAAVLALAAAAPSGAWAEESLMLRCGRAYEAAKAAGGLAGQDWTAYRKACAAGLRASADAPASAASPPAALPTTAPAAPAPDAAQPEAIAVAPVSDGMAAMHARQKRCGAEWTAGKAALVAETPDLTWPKYWSRCNARIKATGR